MQIFKLGEKINDNIVLCLGFFGCMHKGHIELLNRAKLNAQAAGCKVALFTFSNNHLAVLKRDATLPYTFDERLSIYQSLGVDYVITAQFDNEFKRLSGESFLSLLKQYRLQALICGFDHRCGSDRIDSMAIKKYFAGVCPVEIVDEVTVDGIKVSTTLLRQYLINNQIDKANAVLSEPFFVVGKVAHGRGVGKTLGFPTANVSVPDEKLMPSGVFSSKVKVDDKVYPAIVNIGTTPTFDFASKVFEAHIIGFNGDLYGKTVKVSLVKYLRPIQKFNSAEELSMQLQRDKEAALND